MPSGLDFAFIEFGLLNEYFLDINPHQKEAFLLWIDVPQTQTSLEKLVRPIFT